MKFHVGNKPERPDGTVVKQLRGVAMIRHLIVVGVVPDEEERGEKKAKESDPSLRVRILLRRGVRI